MDHDQETGVRLRLSSWHFKRTRSQGAFWPRPRMPLYYEAKLLFVVWLWHPKTRGAVYLYTHTLQVCNQTHCLCFR